MKEKYKALVYREWKVSKKFYAPRVALLGLFLILLGSVVVMLFVKNNPGQHSR